MSGFYYFYEIFCYMKHALNIEEQINKLKEHGMVFDNEEKAKEILLDVGYYRLDSILFRLKKLFPV